MTKESKMKHGTRSMYINGKCRCEECRRANRDHVNAFRKSRSPENAPRHGTAYAYITYNCRCLKCLKAHRLACRNQQAKRTPDQAKLHGVLLSYTVYSCRCDKCRLASSDYRRKSYWQKKGMPVPERSQ